MGHRPGPDLQADEVTALAGEGDPSTAPFTSFTRMAAQAAGKKTAIDLQARTGNEIQVTQSAEGLRHGTAELLALAQHAGTVRADIQIPRSWRCSPAPARARSKAGWDGDLQRRTLTVIFDGLRPHATP
jgi:hypothetical protein